MFFSRDVRHVNADLTVLDLAEPAAPLPRHAHTLGPLLGERRGIEHDHAVRRAEVRPDLTGQRQEERLVLPRHVPDELLEALTLLVVQVGDALTSLVIE